MELIPKIKVVLVFVLATSLCVTGHAEDEPTIDTRSSPELVLFEDIPSVFGASKYEQKVTEAPSRISVVTGKEIRRFGHRTLSDVLNSLPGFFSSNDRNYSYTGVRGFGTPGDYDTRLLQLVNGHRVNDNIYGSMFNDHAFPVDLHLIERIEVIRGPSSSIYGSAAFFAVVNIVTKEGRDLSGWEVSGSAGSLDSKEAKITYGNRLNNGVELIFSAMSASSEGEDRLYYVDFDDPLTNNGVAENVDGEDYEKLFMRASFGDFAVEGAYSKREKSIPTGAYGTVFNSRQNRTWDSRVYLSASYQMLRESGAEVSGRLSYDEYRYDGDYLYDYGTTADPYLSLNRDLAEGRSWSGEVQWVRQFAGHHLVIGSEYVSSISEKQKNLDQDGIYLDVNTDSTIFGLFVQDDLHIAESFHINLGLRLDDYTSFGSTINPRAAAIFTPYEGSTIKLLYGEAFRAPNAFERYYNDSNLTWKPSVDLDPETIRTTELVWEQELGPGFRSTMSVYQNDIEDLIALSTDSNDGLLIFVNQGDAEAEGIEIEFERNWSNSASASFSFTHQEANDSETGDRLVNFATNVSKLNLILPLVSDNIGIAAEATHESGRKTLNGVRSDARTLVNLSLFGEQIINGLTVSASVYNLFDEEYSDPASEEHIQNVIEQNGRTFRIHVNYNF